MIDTELGSAPLRRFLPQMEISGETLLQLTGDKSKLGGQSGLEGRVAAAWVQPLCALSCGQYRMLVGQRFGLRWLAAPVAAFVALYPRAECDLYPGDLAINALLAGHDILQYAPLEAAAMFAADFSWLYAELAENPTDDLISRAVDSLADCRENVRSSGQSDLSEWR